MADFNVVFDPMLDKERAEFVTGGTGGGGGPSYVGGERISIAGGTISFVNSADIVNVTGTSVTLQPDTAYKIYATSQAITLNANPPAAGKWAYEGHLEIFTAGTGYVVTGTNVVLANALEPDSVNNCTVRFHDGIAIISVEDHVAGYIVVSATGTSSGSLYYGLATSTNEYIAIDARLNGQTLDLGGAVTNGEKHVVGNGYMETILTGGVSCTSKTTFANLAMSAATIIANASAELVDGHYAVDTITGTASVTLGKGAILDLTGNTNATPINPSGGITFAPGGATVYPSAGSAGAYTLGGMTVPSVGNTNVVNLNGSQVAIGSNATAKASGCTFTGGTASYGGAFAASATGVLELTDCILSGNSAVSGYGQTLYVSGGKAKAVLNNCTVYDTNINPQFNAGIVARASGVVDIKGGTYATIGLGSGGSVTIGGNNAIGFLYALTTSSTFVRISSGASINLTSSISAAEVTVLEGGCVVNGNAIAAGTYTSIDSTGTPT